MHSEAPQSIQYNKAKKQLQLSYANGEVMRLSAELLRVHSPSAEVRGHGNAVPKLVFGKQHVEIRHIESVGHYAIKLVFSDKHDSGIYTWDYLYELAHTQEQKWDAYLQRLAKEGKTRGQDFIEIKELK